MDRKLYKSAIQRWIEDQEFRQFTTLAFNREITPGGALHFLKEFHARLDRLALGGSWAKKPLNERVFSISFLENPDTNLHYHMLWRSPRHEEKLANEMPRIWEKLIPSGDVDVRPIAVNAGIYGYCTKQLTDHSFILSGEFNSQPYAPQK